MKSILLILVSIGLTCALPQSKHVEFSKPTPLIRGDLLDPHAIPYMVLLEVAGLGDSWYCGGTLISNNYIVTSASCTNGVYQVTARIGAHFVNRPIAGEVIITSTEIIHHENFQNYTNDIAVVKLPQPVEYSDAIQPVLLPKKSDANTNYAGVVARVSGWGANTWGSEQIFEIPRYAFVEVLAQDDAVCGDLAKPFPDTLLCTSGTYEGQTVGPAIGDEGGPLILNGVLIGIISFGYVIWFSGEPAAHTRVASYLDWIEANTDAVVN